MHVHHRRAAALRRPQHRDAHGAVVLEEPRAVRRARGRGRLRRARARRRHARAPDPQPHHPAHALVAADARRRDFKGSYPLQRSTGPYAKTLEKYKKFWKLNDWN